MAQRWQHRLWIAGKILLTVAILIFVGRQFYQDLSKPDAESLPWQPGWILLSAGLYAVFLGILTAYWRHLLHVFGERPTLWLAFRAYYVGLLGKYVPGKAWALLLRGMLVRGPNVRLGVAIYTGFYEVLTTMSAGALVAGVGLLIWPPDVSDWNWQPFWVALGLLVICIVPILPGVSNFVARRMAARFPQVEAYRLAPVRGATLALGLVLASVGWGVLGVSVWAILHSVLPAPIALTWETWGRATARSPGRPSQ
ncbi:MAG: flippase-like domain-containing protein [Planctomycetes bacterium]|nr:flippase-like domain-containing protein [Planctomycetota bacterium]